MGTSFFAGETSQAQQVVSAIPCGGGCGIRAHQGLRVWGWGFSNWGFGVQGLGSRVWGLGSRGMKCGVRSWSSRFRVSPLKAMNA